MYFLLESFRVCCISGSNLFLFMSYCICIATLEDVWQGEGHIYVLTTTPNSCLQRLAHFS